MKLINTERQKNIQHNIDFDSALQIEQTKRYQLLKSSQLHHTNVLDPLLPFGFIEFSHEIKMWESLIPNKIKLDLLTFYQSDHYKKLPFVDLECFLLAKIKTRSDNIKSGDMMDIHHTSSLMPFSNLFITDKVWSNFLKSEKLDEKYNTVVAHLGDENEIKKFFKSL